MLSTCVSCFCCCCADLYVIASDEESFDRILKQTRELMTEITLGPAQAPGAVLENPNPPPPSICSKYTFEVGGQIFEMSR